MTQQYLRQAQLVVGNASGKQLDLSQLQFRFRIARGDIQTPNAADIVIYNVADATATAIQKEFTTVTLQAGYAGSYGVIFTGTIKQVRKGRENATDTYVAVTAADGDGAYNFGIVNMSLKAGSTPQQQIAAIVAALDSSHGITSGTIQVGGQALPRGKVLFGMARDHLRNIASTYQTSWSIQNGKLNMVALNNFVPNETVVLTSATGLIGIPEQTQDGIKVRTLLNPNIKIGGSIKIDNKSIINQYRFGVNVNSQANNALLNQSIHLNADGLYKVLWVDYIGDTRGQEWYSDMTCLAIDAVLGQSQISNPKSVIGPAGQGGPVNPYG